MTDNFEWSAKSLNEVRQALIDQSHALMTRWNHLPIRTRLDPPGNQFREDFEKLNVLIAAYDSKLEELAEAPAPDRIVVRQKRKVRFAAA